MEFFVVSLKFYLNCYPAIDSVKMPPQTSDVIPHVDLCLRTDNRQNISMYPLISHIITNSAAAESYF